MTASTSVAPRLSRSLIFSTISAASAGLLLLLSSLAGHRLPDASFGQFQWLLVLAMIGETLMDLGIHQVTVRAIARNRDDAPRLLQNSLALKVLPAVLMVAVLETFVFVVRPEPPVRLAAALMLGSAVCRSYLLTVRGVLLGLERFGHDSLLVVGDRALLLAAGWVVLANDGGVVDLGWAFLIARGLTVAGALTLAHRLIGGVRPAFDLPLWRELQRTALPIGVFLIVLNFYTYIDTVMLNAMAGDVATGLYRAAYQMYEGLSYAPAILSAVLTPRLAHLWKADRRAHRALALRGVIAAIGMAALLAALAWPLSGTLLAVVFGESKRVADSTLHILLGGLVFLFVIWMLQAVAMSVFKERLLLVATSIGAALNVVLNVFLIPAWGRDGAAWATFAAEAATMAMLAMGLWGTLSRPAPAQSADAPAGR